MIKIKITKKTSNGRQNTTTIEQEKTLGVNVGHPERLGVPTPVVIFTSRPNVL
jgi:hypothetical protein